MALLGVIAAVVYRRRLLGDDAARLCMIIAIGVALEVVGKDLPFAVLQALRADAVHRLARWCIQRAAAGGGG